MDDVSERLPQDLDDVRDDLIAWYERHHRSYPWRETDDPYSILVCEVMSQQTQLDRVLDPWRRFLRLWPSIEELARAELSDVIGFWTEARLGYNARARRLHEAANHIVEEFDGRVPSSSDQLQTLPGVGPYTASAVASFAFDEPVAVVDTNVKRVLYRLVGAADDDEEPPYETIANELLPKDEPGTWNNALMELGALACTGDPDCDEGSCPWRTRCRAYLTGDFTAPDVPTQPSFDGSRRQYRGRVVRVLSEQGQLDLDALGHRIRVDYTPDGRHGRDWLRSILADLEDEGLVTVRSDGGKPVARLAG